MSIGTTVYFAIMTNNSNIFVFTQRPLPWQEYLTLIMPRKSLHIILWLHRVAQCQTYLAKCIENNTLPQNNTVSPMHHYCSWRLMEKRQLYKTHIFYSHKRFPQPHTGMNILPTSTKHSSLLKKFCHVSSEESHKIFLKMTKYILCYNDLIMLI